jgi:ATP-dependent DNA ligase
MFLGKEVRILFKGQAKEAYLELKKREDTEGRVVGYNLRDDGDLKSLLVKMEKTGAVFNLGIGLSDKVRHDYKTIFPMNTLIKFSYREITTSGKPKQARYVGLRLDR